MITSMIFSNVQIYAKKKAILYKAIRLTIYLIYQDLSLFKDPVELENQKYANTFLKESYDSELLNSLRYPAFVASCLE